MLPAGEGHEPIVVFAERERCGRLMRPCTRAEAWAPSIPPEEIRSLAPDPALHPRYAQKARGALGAGEGPCGQGGGEEG